VPDNQFDNDFHKTIVENLADGVYYVDSGREIQYWNRGAERITGYASAQVVGIAASTTSSTTSTPKGTRCATRSARSRRRCATVSP